MRISPAALLPTDPDVVIQIGAPPPSATTPQGFEIYAYSFWRHGSSPTGMLGNGQYGGSQSAVIAAIPMLRFSGNPGLSRLSLNGRASVAHGSARERELAAGVRWRPVARIPVQVIAERRFRENRPDAFAALVAGGQSGVKLPLGFRLDGYGQAGFVSGQGGGPFADVAAHAHRPIAQSHNRKTHLLRLAQGFGAAGKTMSCASMSAQISAQMWPRAARFSNLTQAGVGVLRATHSRAMGQR